MKLKKLSFSLVFVLMLSLCACGKKDPNIIPVTNNEYDGFVASYINHDEEVCSTFLNISSNGEIMYGYDDGCIYKDYDLYEKYEYKNGNLVFISDSSNDIIENKVVEWTCEKLVMVEDGEEKTFEVDYFLYLTDEMLEDTYEEKDSSGETYKTYEFSASGEVLITNEYSDEEATYSLAYDPINDVKIVTIDILGMGTGQYVLDESNKTITFK